VTEQRRGDHGRALTCLLGDIDKGEAVGPGVIDREVDVVPVLVSQYSLRGMVGSAV
jgi:hypothetical protein